MNVIDYDLSSLHFQRNHVNLLVRFQTRTFRPHRLLLPEVVGPRQPPPVPVVALCPPTRRTIRRTICGESHRHITTAARALVRRRALRPRPQRGPLCPHKGTRRPCCPLVRDRDGPARRVTKVSVQESNCNL